MAQKGTIGVTTDNIFPVIKKFLYSDHDIFLREIVSNAVDATQKLKTLAQKGEVKGETGDLKVHVTLDKKKGTLTVSDRGIGMTEEEIDKYINQIAFSGANEFLDKYKDDANAIIGHFGLGFYSAFMVSKQVEIVTRSYKEGAQAVRWTCDGSPAFEISEADKAERGTDIILHIDDDCKEFLEKSKIQELLTRYCRFLPVEIAFGKKTEWKDGKETDTQEDNIINDVNPLWRRKPADLKDEDYLNFYRSLYPMADDPLFWIHLNVDFPFNLTGVLYFPKIKNNLDLQRNKIQLYCNQVFVTDQVENIVPDFLTLLHGVIDSPDIPLNVSRSYLQSDANVKKISTYITKKVSDRLNSIFKENRKEFEEKWDDLKLFIHYGMLSQDDFYDRAKDFALLRDTEGKHFTYEEHRTLVKENQTDKNGQLICLYTTDHEAQYPYIQGAKDKGYSVLEMEGQLDVPMVGLLERKLEKTRFSRVDSDVIGKLIEKEEAPKASLSEEESERLSGFFKSRLPQEEKVKFTLEVQSMGAEAQPMQVTQSEYMRRMKDMSLLQSGMNFYGEMPDMYTVVLNSDHPLIQKIMKDGTEATAAALAPIEAEIKGLEARRSAIEQMQKDKKPEEITEEERTTLQDCDKELSAERAKKDTVLADYAAKEPLVHELIDLALLQNNMLRGEALSRFVKRSVEMLGQA